MCRNLFYKLEFTAMISGPTILREFYVYNILFAELQFLQLVRLQAPLQIWCYAYLVGHMQAKNSSCIT